MPVRSLAQLLRYAQPLVPASPMKRVNPLAICGSWIVILAGLIGCESGPITQGRLATVDVLSCRDLTATELAEQIPYWERAIRESSEPPRVTEGWDDLVNNMLQAHPGLLLSIRVREQAWVDLHRSWGDPKKITVDRWEESGKEELVFAEDFGQSCDKFETPSDSYIMLNYVAGETFIPSHPARFLLIPRLERAPQLLEPFLPSD